MSAEPPQEILVAARRYFTAAACYFLSTWNFIGPNSFRGIAFACLNLQEGMRMCRSHHIYAHGGELMRRTSLIVVLIDV